MKNTEATKSNSMFGQDSEALKKAADQVETVVRQAVERHPLASLLAVFGVGVALGAAEDKLRLKGVIGDIGRRVADNQQGALLDHAFDAAFGSMLLKTGLTVLSEQLGSLIPNGKRGSGLASTKTKMVN